MNKKNCLLALTFISALGVSSISTLNVQAKQTPVINEAIGDISENGTIVMDETSIIKYFQSGDPADGTLAKDKWGQYTGWTRVYKDGDNAVLNGQYNDNEWQSAAGTFDTTAEDSILDKNAAAYFFRGYFTVDNTAEVAGIHLNFDYKDAVIVYLNGQQLTALNVPDEGYRTTGDSSGSHKDNLGFGSKEAYSEVRNADMYFRDIKDMLVNGDNVIAVELHKTNGDSDAYFKMNELALNPEESKLPERDSLKAISLSIGATPLEMNLNWFSTASDGGTLQYAKKSAMTGSEFPEAQAITVSASTSKAQAAGYYANKATMSNLEENTEYVYRVGNHGEWSETYTTSTKSSGDFSFLFAGDPQLGSSGDLASDKDGWKNTLDLVKDNSLFADVNFIQNAGDHVEAGNNESQYDAYLSNYEGSVVYSVPFANAVGNHDYKGTAYNDHFNLPNVSDYGSSGEGNAEGDYYYVYNNTLMLVLNSNNLSTAEHEQFIDEAIAATANEAIQWRIVVFHHSIYSTASHANDSDILDRRSTLAPMFSEKGIDLVLMGHDHVYTRSMLMDGLTPLTELSFDDQGNPINDFTNPQGILYITANSASGSKYYEFSGTLTGEYVAVKDQSHRRNITKVNVSDDKIEIATYYADDLSLVDDIVTIKKTSAVTADKSELQDAVHEVKALEASKYTEASFAALQNALTDAEAVLAKEDADQAVINEALKTLKEAQSNLKLKDTVKPEEPGQPDEEKPAENGSATKDPVLVATGDRAPVVLTVIAASAAAIGVAGVWYYKVKTKKKEI